MLCNLCRVIWTSVSLWWCVMSILDCLLWSWLHLLVIWYLWSRLVVNSYITPAHLSTEKSTAANYSIAGYVDSVLVTLTHIDVVSSSVTLCICIQGSVVIDYLPWRTSKLLLSQLQSLLGLLHLISQHAIVDSLQLWILRLSSLANIASICRTALPLSTLVLVVVDDCISVIQVSAALHTLPRWT
jgi:hypothetical protein